MLVKNVLLKTPVLLTFMIVLLLPIASVMNFVYVIPNSFTPNQTHEHTSVLPESFHALSSDSGSSSQTNRGLHASSQPVLNQGDDFSNAIQLTFTPGPNNTYLRSNASGSLTPNQQAIYFKFTVDQNLLVHIFLNASIPSSYFSMDVQFDLFAGSNIEYVGGNYDPVQPKEYDFITSRGGDYFLVLYATNDVTIDIPFFFAVIVYSRGQLPENNLQTEIIHSSAYEKLNDELWYLRNDTNYLSLTGNMNASSSYNFLLTNNGLTGVALSIYALLRAGDFLAQSLDVRANPSDSTVTLKHHVFSVFLNESMRLFMSVNTSLLHPTGALFYEPSSDPSIPSYDFTLQTNTFMLLAMLELWQYYHDDYFGTRNDALADSFLNQINTTALAINSTFYHPTYHMFVDSVIVNQNTTITPSSYSTTTVLGPLSLLTEVFNRVVEANNAALGASTAIQSLLNSSQAIVDFMIANMTLTSHPSVTLDSYGGIAADSFDFSTNTTSDTASLFNEALYASVFIPTSSSTPYLDLERATSILLNTVSLFRSSSNDLLFDQVSLLNDTTSEITTSLSTMLFFSTMNRLITAWRLANTTESWDNARTWTKAWNSLRVSFETVLYDTDSASFFAYYNHVSKTIHRNEADLFSSSFAANTYALDYFASIFPISAIIQYSRPLVVNQDSLLILKIKQITPHGSWVWFTPEQEFNIYADLQTSDHEIQAQEDIDLSTFNFDQEFFDYTYAPITRGALTISLQLSLEGVAFLKGSVNATVYGRLQPSFTVKDFRITSADTSFSATVTMVDENGLALSNIVLNASLLAPYDEIPVSKYKLHTRTDSSGHATLSFDLSTLFEDINLNLSDTQDIEIPIFINATNAKTFNLISTDYIVIPLYIKVANVYLTVSPTNLEIIQGSSDSYTFTVNVFDENANAIANAQVHYEIGSLQNSVTTGTDGEATITLSSEQIQLFQPPSVTLTLTVQANHYPVTIFQREITIVPNSLNIQATPVQITTETEIFFLQSTTQTVDLEVATEDRFSRTVLANVSLQWAGEDPGLDLSKYGSHLTPYTFTLDLSKLPPGEYQLLIIATKTGLTSPDNPATLERTIIVSRPSIADALLAAFFVYGGFILGKVLLVAYHFGSKLLGLKRECPYCGETISNKKKVCPYCGRDVPTESLRSKTMNSQTTVSQLSEPSTTMSPSKTPREDDTDIS